MCRYLCVAPLLLIVNCWAIEPNKELLTKFEEWKVQYSKTYSSPNKELLTKFEEWKVQYSKTYSSDEEEKHRFVAFVENLQRMVLMANKTGAVYGPDQFTDIPHAQFIAQYTCGHVIPGYGSSDDTFTMDPDHIRTLQDVKAFDWRDHGAVSGAKNQGAYGTCWSFGAAAVLEGMSVLAGHPLENCSSQELIDCCDACQGRSPDISFDWLIANTNGYADTLASYPYAGPRQKCKMSSATESKAQIGSWKKVYDNDNQDKIMSIMLEHGPGNVGIDASCLNGYKSGVIQNCTGESVDHAVVIIGVGTDNGVDYFTVKNSWGDSFGEHGFFRVAKGKQQMKLDTIWVALAK